MNLIDGPDWPLLTVTIETGAVVPAETAATIIEEVAKGFERHARKKGRRDLRLGLRRVDIGSLVIVFTAIGTPNRIPVPNTVAAGFVEAVEKRMLVAQGLADGTLKGAELRLVDALRGPVADGTAERVVLAAPAGKRETAVDSSVVRLIERARGAALASRPPPRPRLPAPRAQVPSLLELKEKPGTVFDVKGRWYVRLEGEGGVLNPLEIGTGMVVEDGAVYLFDGSWEGRSYRIRAARRIG